MTRDEQRAKCIEAQADALYRFDIGAAGGLAEEKKWATSQGLQWPTVTTRQYYLKAAAAFDSLNDIVRVNPIEVTEEMIEAGKNTFDDQLVTDSVRGIIVNVFSAMYAVGDLTNPPETKL